VASAIERANRILVGSDIRLAAAWMQGGANGIPVYLVRPRQGTASTIAAVPLGCLCIFVDPELSAAWALDNAAGTGRLELTQDYVLTFILLHEAGHLADKTSAAQFENGIFSQLNIDPSRAKANEERADEFAARQLRHHAFESGVSATSLEANLVTNELMKVSWNMQAYRSLDQFGSTVLGTRSVFFDRSYSHPNLAWRVLRVNYLIDRSDTTRHLLESFEEARGRGANQEPPYQRDSK